MRPTLAPPPVADRRRRGGLPLLEAMGFSERDLPHSVTPIAVAPPPPPPVRLAPAFAPTSTPVVQRPRPSRPTPARPISPISPPADTRAIVEQLWLEADEEALGAIPAPQEIDLDRRVRSRRLPSVISVALVLVIITSVFGTVLLRGRSAAADASTRAHEATAAANEVASDVTTAGTVIADPSSSPSSLSDAAATISALTTASHALSAVGHEQIDEGLGTQDPIPNRGTYETAGAAGDALSKALSQLLTTRLILEDFVSLPALSTRPEDAAMVSADLAAAFTRARTRLDDVPDSHAAIAADAVSTLERLGERSIVYATDLRNGAPVGGHLSALTEEVDAFYERLARYLAAQEQPLGALADTFTASVSALGQP